MTNEMNDLAYRDFTPVEECITAETEVVVPLGHYEQLVKDSAQLNLIRKAYDTNLESYNFDRLFALLFGPRREDGDAQ